MDYNDSKTWLDVSLHTPPEGFDVAAYQAKIDAICGLNEFGGPNVLLTWMPHPDNYNRRYCEWNAAGFGTKDELRALYVYQEMENGLGDTMEIPPPRWALKQFVHPAWYLAHDERVRWSKQLSPQVNVKLFTPGETKVDGVQEGSQVWVREVRPPRPATGFYTPMTAIGRHNGHCCKRKKKDREPCWGKYREPDDAHLEQLRRAVAIRAESGEERPDAGLTNKVLKLAALEAADAMKRREELADLRMGEFVEANLDAMLAHTYNDPSFLERTKAFSLPTGGGSGLIIASK